MDSNIASVYFAILAILIPFLIIACNWIVEYTGMKSNKRKRDEANESFDKIVENLASDNPASQLSAAVLLRRFLVLKIGRTNYLHKETVDVISSILRTLSNGIYQKTLADGLAYSPDLSYADLQKTNLQNVYLGSKSATLKLRSTDLFMANLTYGLIDKVDAVDIILYNALLYGATLKNSDFSNAYLVGADLTNAILKKSNFSYANFEGANLTNAKFDGVLLLGAKFTNATNVPAEIKEFLEDGVYTLDKPVTTSVNSVQKSIFFSMPGNMSKSDEVTVVAYRQYLMELGYEVIYYNRDTYPRFGQLSQIKASIEKCAAMVAFGSKQTFIKEGVYRPGMCGERSINDSWLSTPWNEVEVGMATMIGIPILLVKDEDIVDGIFDDVISESFIFTITSKTDIKELDRNQVFTSWISKIA